MNKYLIITVFIMSMSVTGFTQRIVKCIDPSKIVFTAKMDSLTSMDQGVYINIKTSIKNNSSDTLRYLSMSCSWAKYYQITSATLHLPIPQCDNDSAILVSVLPHHSQKTILRVISLMSPAQLHNTRFKVRMTFVQACDIDKASRELRRSKNLILSNTVLIK